MDSKNGILKSVRDYIKECEAGTLESSLYTIVDELGRKVIVRLQKRCGALVSTLQSNGWYETVDYDVDGFVQGVTYEKDVA